jgi:hypothetical protein
MPRTGDHCTVAGQYRGDCTEPGCGQVWTVTMKVGDEFPPCPHKHRAVNYVLL